MLRLIVAFILILGLTSTVAAQDNGRIPIQALTATSNASMVRLSPDGSRLAALKSGPGDDFVYILDAADPTKVVRKIEIGNFALAEMRWTNNHRLLLHPYFSVSFLGLTLSAAQLMVIDVDNGEIKQLDGASNGFRASDVLYLNPAGQSALIAGLDKYDESPSVMKMDLDTGKFIKIQNAIPGVWDWFVDGAGLLRGGVAHDGLRWKLYYRSRAAEPLVKITGKFDKKAIDVIEKVYFSPVGGQTMVVSNHQTGRFAAYRLNLDTVEPEDLVFENPNGDIDELLIDPDSYQVIGARYQDERLKTRWFDADFAKLQARLDKAFPGSDNQLADWSRDRNKILVYSSAPDNSGSYYILDRVKSEMKVVLVPYPKIAAVQLAPTKFVRFNARDGLSVPAYLTMPTKNVDGPVPLIMMPHGGPFANDRWVYQPWVQFLADRGYAVFQPQFRGTTGFGRSYVERGYGEFGAKMLDDIDDGMDWLVKQGLADPKRTCIMGASYGGYAALYGAIRNPGRYRCAISWAGVTDVKDQLKYSRSIFSAQRYYRDWRDQVIGVDEKKADLESISPARQAARVKFPLLIGHGKEDDVVPFSQAESLDKALRRNGVKFESVYIDTADHNISLPDDETLWLWNVEKFLAANNPTDRLTPASVSTFPLRKDPAKGAPPATKAKD